MSQKTRKKLITLASCSLTGVRAVHVDKLGPSIVFDHSHQSILELRPQLDHKLVRRFDGEGRSDEADMQCPAERRQHVDRLPVVQADDGVHALGELGANCQRQNKQKRQRV